MKRIFLLVSALVLVVSNASAWIAKHNEAVVILATKHLTSEGAALVKAYLGDSFEDDANYIGQLEKAKSSPYAKSLHSLYLTSDFQPMAVEVDNAMSVLQKSIETVRDSSNKSSEEVTAAMRMIICLMCDIHNFGNVRIENIPHSQSDFSFAMYKTAHINKENEILKKNWSQLWLQYIHFHKGYSAAYWAEDFEICYGDKFAQYTSGTLNDWVKEIGTTAAKLYNRITPEYIMPRVEYLRLEEVMSEMVAKSGFRLAAIFNDLAK